MFDTQVEQFVWDEDLCRLRKTFYDALDKIFQKILSQDEKIQDDIASLLKISQKYQDTYNKKFGYTPKKKNKLGEKSSSHHYEVQKDNHDNIVWVQEVKSRQLLQNL